MGCEEGEGQWRLQVESGRWNAMSSSRGKLVGSNVECLLKANVQHLFWHSVPKASGRKEVGAAGSSLNKMS